MRVGAGRIEVLYFALHRQRQAQPARRIDPASVAIDRKLDQRVVEAPALPEFAYLGLERVGEERPWRFSPSSGRICRRWLSRTGVPSGKEDALMITLKDGKIIDQWSTLIEQCQGEGEGLLRGGRRTSKSTRLRGCTGNVRVSPRGC